MKGRIPAPALAVAAALGLVTAVAWAAPVDIPAPDGFQQKLKLTAGGGAFFDVYQPPEQYNSGCALGDLGGLPADDAGYSPASDAAAGTGADDVFDGGLVLAVRGGGGTKIFEDSNSKGRRSGEQLAVGPEKLRGLIVARTERALQSSPTLRSLIKLRNPRRKPLRRTLIWDSDLGADEFEVVRASSSGDKALTARDRWVAVGDDPVDPSDGQPIFVLYGKGQVAKTKVFNPVVDQDSCVSWSLTLKIPAKSTRYALFFTQVHDDELTPKQLAGRAQPFNRRSLSPKLLRGIGPKVRNRVVNWGL